MMQAALPSHFRMRMLPGFSRVMWRKPGEIYYIGGADILPNPLSPQQESAVIESLTKEDSQQARASLIEHNLRLVVDRNHRTDQGNQYLQSGKED